MSLKVSQIPKHDDDSTFLLDELFWCLNTTSCRVKQDFCCVLHFKEAARSRTATQVGMKL